MKTEIYVPSRHRPDMMARTAEAALDSGLTVNVFVEPQDHDEYAEALPDEVVLETLEENDQGIGYVRARMLEHAVEAGIDVMVMNDDDVLLPENTVDLAFAVDYYDIPGAGAWHRILKHFADIPQGTGVHAQTGSLGVRTFALNVEAAVLVGGFDESFRFCSEDYDLLLRLILEGFGPWGVHSGVEATQIGKRLQPGGISSLPGEVSDNELEMAHLFADKHPRYVSVTSKGKPRVQWKKAYVDTGFDWPLRIGHERDADHTASFEFEFAD